jgi:hypothetical protein
VNNPLCTKTTQTIIKPEKSRNLRFEAPALFSKTYKDSRLQRIESVGQPVLCHCGKVG